MKLLVTGGAGFIGSNFIRHVFHTRRDIDIVNLDKLTYAGNPESLSDLASDSRYQFVLGDIADPVLVAELFHRGFDAAVNFAAETHVDRSIDRPVAVSSHQRGGDAMLIGRPPAPQNSLASFTSVPTRSTVARRPGPVSAKKPFLIRAALMPQARLRRTILCPLMPTPMVSRRSFFVVPITTVRFSFRKN